MEQDLVLLYNSRWLQLRYAAIGLLLSGVVIWQFYKERTNLKAPWVGYFLGGLLFGVGVYFLQAFILKRPEITLSKLGIDFRHDGFYSWDMIDSFSVLHYDYKGEDSSSDLTFHFRWQANVTISLSMLEKDWEEVVELIQKWNTNTSLYYRGTRTK